MNYKILRLSGIHYHNVTKNLINRIPNFSSLSYMDQMSAFHESSVMYSDSFSKSMKLLGNDAHEIIVDFPDLQKSWAKERGVHIRENNWKSDILFAQIEHLRPDVVYIQSYAFTKPGIFDKGRPNINLMKILKERFSFIKLVILFYGFPGSFPKVENADIIFAGSPNLVSHCKRMGLSSILLYHGFDDKILNKLDNNNVIDYGFTFLGSSGYDFGLSHKSRYWTLMELILRTDINLWLNEPIRSDHKFGLTKQSSLKLKLRSAIIKKFKNYDSCRLRLIKSKNYLPAKLRNLAKESSAKVEDNTKVDPLLPPIPLRELFPHRCNDAVHGLNMYRILKRSKVTFNVHTDETGNSVANMRLFEATGVGTCLLTDTRENMGDLFEADKEVITYSTVDEAVEKVNFLLENDNMRREIAEAGQRRTLQNHTINHRCQEIDKVIKDRL